MGGKWKPSREGIESAFNELAMAVSQIDLPQSDRQIVLDLCHARRDMQLALLGYRRPDAAIRKHAEFGGMVVPIAKVVR